jgi:hypothetical protein
MSARISGMAKAVLAALIAGVGSLSAVMVDDKGFGDVTDGQWVAVVLAALVALGGVYAIPNRTE